METHPEYSTIKISYFDVSNNMNVKKLYKTLSYIYMMLCRYCTLQDVELHLDFWTWDKYSGSVVKTKI